MLRYEHWKNLQFGRRVDELGVCSVFIHLCPGPVPAYTPKWERGVPDPEGGGPAKQTAVRSMSSDEPTSDTVSAPCDNLCMSKVPPFLSKLYQIVDSPAPYCHWGAEGNTFVVTNPVRFAAEVLPQWFKHSSMASFSRQLLTYGFRRLHSGSAGGATAEFHHKYFVRGDQSAMLYIQRRGSKKMRSEPDQMQDTLLATGSRVDTGDEDSLAPSTVALQTSRIRQYLAAAENSFVRSITDIKARLVALERQAFSAYGARPVDGFSSPRDPRAMEPLPQAAMASTIAYPSHAANGHPQFHEHMRTHPSMTPRAVDPLAQSSPPAAAAAIPPLSQGHDWHTQAPMPGGVGQFQISVEAHHSVPPAMPLPSPAPQQVYHVSPPAVPLVATPQAQQLYHHHPYAPAPPGAQPGPAQGLQAVAAVAAVAHEAAVDPHQASGPSHPIVVKPRGGM